MICGMPPMTGNEKADGSAWHPTSKRTLLCLPSVSARCRSHVHFPKVIVYLVGHFFRSEEVPKDWRHGPMRQAARPSTHNCRWRGYRCRLVSWACHLPLASLSHPQNLFMTLRGRQCHKAPLGQHHLNLKCICQALMHQSPPTKLIFACHLRGDLRCAPSCTCPSTAASSTAVSLHWWIAIFGLNVKQSHTNARPKSYLICLVHFVLRQRVNPCC